MSELPNAQKCKRLAVETLAKMADLDPRDADTPEAGRLLISAAQVWATLATVPDEIIEVREALSEPEQCTNLCCSRSQPHDRSPECPVPPGTSGRKSGGGAGQWNG